MIHFSSNQSQNRSYTSKTKLLKNNTPGCAPVFMNSAFSDKSRIWVFFWSIIQTKINYRLRQTLWVIAKCSHNDAILAMNEHTISSSVRDNDSQPHTAQKVSSSQDHNLCVADRAIVTWGHIMPIPCFPNTVPPCVISGTQTFSPNKPV